MRRAHNIIITIYCTFRTLRVPFRDLLLVGMQKCKKTDTLVMDFLAFLHVSFCFLFLPVLLCRINADADCNLLYYELEIIIAILISIRNTRSFNFYVIFYVSILAYFVLTLHLFILHLFSRELELDWKKKVFH